VQAAGIFLYDERMSSQNSPSRIKDILLIVLIVGAISYAAFVYISGKILSVE
jgi:hypothetical protein